MIFYHSYLQSTQGYSVGKHFEMRMNLRVFNSIKRQVLTFHVSIKFRRKGIHF